MFITMRGMVEVYADVQKTQTTWQPRPPDPYVEAEMLGRLMQKLAAKPPGDARGRCGRGRQCSGGHRGPGCSAAKRRRR